jgi:hypothetical protein
MNIKRKLKNFISLIHIRWNNRKLFSLYKKVIKLGEIIFTNDRVIWDKNNHFSMIIVSFLTKFFNRMSSINLLCKNGQAKDGALILRSVFEDFIDFKYMAEHKDSIVDFIDFDSYIRLKMGRTLLQLGGKNIDKDAIKKRNQELENQWGMVKSRFTYRDKTGKTNIFNRWTKCSLRETAETIGLDETYPFLYGYLSNSFAHSNSVGMDDYILGISNGNVVVSLGTTSKYIEEVLVTVCAIFLDVLSIVNEEYKLGWDEEIKQLSACTRKKS